MDRHSFTRRGFMIAGGAAATSALAACNNGITSSGGAVIDQRVDATESFLFNTYPQTRDLAAKAAGILYMPLITKAGFGVGGSYGRGALRINGSTVDYYSAATATFGVQFGVQQYAHALFFMTEPALRSFRTSAGWTLGADAEYAVKDFGGNLSADIMTATSPVIALVFGQAGLIIGATLAGTKYTRIIP